MPVDRKPSDKDIQALVERHRAFWRRENAGGPLLRVFPGEGVIYPLRSTRLPPPGRPVQPEDLTLDCFWHRYEGECLIPPGSSTFSFAFPLTGFPWMEAILGCPIEVVPGSSSLWVRPIPDADWDTLLSLTLRDDNPWLQRLLALMDELVARADGRYVVTTGHIGGLLHGASDMLAGVLGNERMCYELYDHPEEVAQFLLQMTDIWIAVVGRLLERIPPFHGGYVNGYGIWAPGPAPIWIEDALLFFSPANYRRFLLPCDRKAFGAFPCSGMHLHSAALYILDDLLVMEELRVLQVGWDTSGPPLEELLQACRRILDQKPLILCGSFTEEEQARVLEALPHEGLCFLPRTPEVRPVPRRRREAEP